MPPRYAYWTILAGGLPTAFRAAEREELQPTFHRLKERHPDAELKYFARGKLWASKDEADAARASQEVTRRGKDWRPGGEHRDPRQRAADERKAKNQARRQARWDRTHREERREENPPRGSERPAATKAAKPAFRPKTPYDRRPSGDRPYSQKPPASRPFRPSGGPSGAGGFGPRRPSTSSSRPPSGGSAVGRSGGSNMPGRSWGGSSRPSGPPRNDSRRPNTGDRRPGSGDRSQGGPPRPRNQSSDRGRWQGGGKPRGRK